MDQELMEFGVVQLQCVQVCDQNSILQRKFTRFPTNANILIVGRHKQSLGLVESLGVCIHNYTFFLHVL